MYWKLKDLKSDTKLAAKKKGDERYRRAQQSTFSSETWEKSRWARGCAGGSRIWRDHGGIKNPISNRDMKKFKVKVLCSSQ